MGGFFEKVGLGGKSSLLSKEESVHVRLTEMGEEKVKNPADMEGMEFEVAKTIKMRQPCTAKEVGDIIHQPANKVYHFFQILKEKDWIQPAA